MSHLLAGVHVMAKLMGDESAVLQQRSMAVLSTR